MGFPFMIWERVGWEARKRVGSHGKGRKEDQSTQRGARAIANSMLGTTHNPRTRESDMGHFEKDNSFTTHTHFWLSSGDLFSH